MKTIQEILKPTTRRTVLLHVVCWCLFVGYEMCFLYFTQLKFVSGTAFSFFCYYSVNICLFYSQLHLLEITFQENSRYYLKGLALFVARYLLFMLIKAALDIAFGPPVRAFGPMLQTAKVYLYPNTFRNVYFCVFATFYWVAGNIAGYRRRTARAEMNNLIALNEKAELETRFAEARNAYLQQQLNPHLLFNSLNFIYSSVYKHSEDASRCVLLLSEIMRFSLGSNSIDGRVPVSAELEQVNNLIGLNRFRFGNGLYLQSDLPDVAQDIRIIPLVLLTLTENLFKHGNLTDPAYPAELKISVDASGLLTYSSRNRKKAKSKLTQRNGLGLYNTRIRLDHSYPGGYKLSTLEEEHAFELKLTIQL